MKKTIEIVSKVFFQSLAVSLLIITFLMFYLAGFKAGNNNNQETSDVIIQKGETKIVYITPKPAPIARVYPKWGGPELWDAVNKKRVEMGVNPMRPKSELCTIASIRLNQLLELGKLDGHEGFGKLPQNRTDIKWIFDENDISEFLVSGATNPAEAVSLWENTLGHKKLLTGGEYTYGCIYAQSGFGVAIAAY